MHRRLFLKLLGVLLICPSRVSLTAAQTMKEGACLPGCLPMSLSPGAPAPPATNVYLPLVRK